MVFTVHMRSPSGSRFFSDLEMIGKYGVGIFFVLSAYLIGELLLREREKTGTVDLKKFYIRRILRIWPLYFLVLGLGIVLGLVFHQQPVSAGFALCYTFLLGSFYNARYGPSGGILYTLWTLSIEEQFYAIIPGVMRIGAERALRIASFVILFLSYATLFYFGVFEKNAMQAQQVYFNSLINFQFFAGGTLLCLLLHGKQWRPAFPVRVALLVGSFAGLLFCADTLKLETKAIQGAPALMGGAAISLLCTTGIFLTFLNLNHRFVNRLAYFGRISYGLYMYHALGLLLVFYSGSPAGRYFLKHQAYGDALALLVTIGLAAASFQWFEQPILRLKSRFEVVKTGRSDGEPQPYAEAIPMATTAK